MQLITTLSVALLLVASVIAQATINTSGAPTVGQPFLFSWSGGQAPYFPSIIPAGQVSATPLQTFDQTTSNSFSFVWPSSIPAGTAVNLALRDGTGAQSFSGQLTVLPGSGTASSASGSSAATGASTASTPASSGASSAATSAASSVSASSVASSVASPSSIAITRSATPSASGTSARPTSASPASATPSPSQGAASNIKVASGLMAAAGLIAVALA